MDKTPIFVKIEEYDELSKIFSSIQDKISEAAELLEGIERLKKEEEEQLRQWASYLIDAQERSKEIREALTTK